MDNEPAKRATLAMAVIRLASVADALDSHAYASLCEQNLPEEDFLLGLVAIVEGAVPRTDQRIVKARQIIHGWRDEDSAEHYNMLRDLDEVLLAAAAEQGGRDE